MVVCDPVTRLAKEDLVKVFDKPNDQCERVGIEVEIAAADIETGCSRPYNGKRGIRELLEIVLERGGGHQILEGGNLVGMKRDDATQITLEPGGAIEYASAPAAGVVQLMEKTHEDLRFLADCAAHLNIALLPGSNYPFNDVTNINWAPKRHSEIVRDYLATLGPDGAWAREVMALTLSTQVTLDYTGEEDLSRKLRMQVAVSPVATALFVNSPLEGGRWTGVLSRRMQYWTGHDPQRSGLLLPGLTDHFTVSRFVDWATSLRMIYRKNDHGAYVAAPNKPFAALLDEGYEDGSLPTWSDWLLHLSQIWTDVRLRQTLELRAVDGPPYPYLATVPAFWVGLTYHAPSCDAAWKLLKGYSVVDYRKLMAEVAVKGMQARLRGTPVSELAGELLRLARQGLNARVAEGLENASVLSYMEPLEAVLSSGKTFAECCIERWQTEFHNCPKRYVQVYRI
jgi:glutamate--cysteine ligase